MGKTFKDIKKFDIKRHKEIARDFTMDMDLSTRVKPKERKQRGGGKNWQKEIDNWIEDDNDELNEDAISARHAMTGE
jgi:hypothetical protein